MDSIRDFLLRLAREDKGQDLIEYALLSGFISLGSVAIILTLAVEVSDLFITIEDAVLAAGAS